MLVDASVPPTDAGIDRRILVLPRYGRLGASSRLRMFQFFPMLEASGLRCAASALFDDAMLGRRYGDGRYGLGAVSAGYLRRLRALADRAAFDLVWIEKEALPWLPASIERILLDGVPYALDFDDAVFHGYDLHPNPLVRRALGDRIDQLMAGARLVVAGNGYLAARASGAGARRVEIVPTVVDLQRYPAPPPPVRATGKPMRVVWIGSPSSAKYLQLLRDPLRELGRRCRFQLLVVGGGDVDLPGVDVLSMPWREADEVRSLQSADVGIMPLSQTPWELGKCGYKLVQYMAAGLPVVASPVGANVDIVEDGATGFLAAQPSDWVACLQRLLDDDALRARMGETGRRRVERMYSLQAQGPRLTRLLQEAAS